MLTLKSSPIEVVFAPLSIVVAAIVGLKVDMISVRAWFGEKEREAMKVVARDLLLQGYRAVLLCRGVGISGAVRHKWYKFGNFDSLWNSLLKHDNLDSSLNKSSEVQNSWKFEACSIKSLVGMVDRPILPPSWCPDVCEKQLSRVRTIKAKAVSYYRGPFFKID